MSTPFTPFIIEPDPQDRRTARVRIGECHTGSLTLGEILEQVLALMRPPLRNPYPMLTDAEWEARFAPVETPLEVE